MNKQIAIFATACLVVSLMIAGNTLSRVFAQQLEQAVRSNPSITNATSSDKVTSFVVLCDSPTLSHGAKLEAHNCKLPNEAKSYPYTVTCPTAQMKSADLEQSCDIKPAWP